MRDNTTTHPAALELRKIDAEVYADRLVVIEVNGIEVAAITFDYDGRQSHNPERCALQVTPVLYSTPAQDWPSFTVGGSVRVGTDPEVHERNETLVALLTRGINDGKPNTTLRKVKR